MQSSNTQLFVRSASRAKGPAAHSMIRRDKPEIHIDDEIILDSTFEDRSSVGGIKETTTVEKEDSYFSLRAQLVENYKYMMDHNMLAWLK